MRLDFALLAESVSLAGDKLYIHGAPLRRIDVPQLPWAASMGIGLSFTADLDEAGAQHEVQFRLSGPEADPVVIEGPPMRIGLPEPGAVPPDFERLSALAAIEIGIVGFTIEGWHRVDLTLDGEPLKTLDLRIVVMPQLRERMVYSEAEPSVETEP